MSNIGWKKRRPRGARDQGVGRDHGIIFVSKCFKWLALVGYCLVWVGLEWVGLTAWTTPGHHCPPKNSGCKEQCHCEQRILCRLGQGSRNTDHESGNLCWAKIRKLGMKCSYQAVSNHFVHACHSRNSLKDNWCPSCRAIVLLWRRQNLNCPWLTGAVLTLMLELRQLLSTAKEHQQEAWGKWVSSWKWWTMVKFLLQPPEAILIASETWYLEDIIPFGTFFVRGEALIFGVCNLVRYHEAWLIHSDISLHPTFLVED